MLSKMRAEISLQNPTRWLEKKSVPLLKLHARTQLETDTGTSSQKKKGRELLPP
jgi:hypothetical protein